MKNKNVHNKGFYVREAHQEGGDNRIAGEGAQHPTARTAQKTTRKASTRQGVKTGRAKKTARFASADEENALSRQMEDIEKDDQS
jgi:hypothetical protein